MRSRTCERGGRGHNRERSRIQSRGVMNKASRKVCNVSYRGPLGILRSDEKAANGRARCQLHRERRCRATASTASQRKCVSHLDVRRLQRCADVRYDNGDWQREQRATPAHRRGQAAMSWKEGRSGVRRCLITSAHAEARPVLGRKRARVGVCR